MKHSLALALRDAVPIVANVARGQSLTEALARWRASPADELGASAVIDLTHGTLRRYGLVQYLVRALSNREPDDPVLQALLWCALYALESGRYAPYTVVDQAVRACGLLEKWNAKRYVNAVLRSYGRRTAELHAGAKDVAEARYQHPSWWIQALRKAFPEDWERILDTSNGHPPMSLRINRRRTTVDAYAARLAAEGIPAKPVGEDGLFLERPVAVARLPGFAAGDVSVQDAGAQWAAAYLDARDGMRVLDACAAPGGKTTHILERANPALVALDADPERLARVAANLERLKLRAKLVAADCTALSAWWDGTPFDRVLADVPCSAAGVVRRHPDIKWLRRPDDFAGFAHRQALILDALWRVLRPGGKLLYVTCSVFPQENDEGVETFVARATGARRLPLPDGSPGQKLPDAQHDGFYYALVEKEA